MEFVGEQLINLGIDAGKAFPSLGALALVLAGIGVAIKLGSEEPDAKKRATIFVVLGACALVVGVVFSSGASTYCKGLPVSVGTYVERLKCARYGLLPRDVAPGLDPADIFVP